MRTFEQTEAASSISNAAKSTNANRKSGKKRRAKFTLLPFFIPPNEPTLLFVDLSTISQTASHFQVQFAVTVALISLSFAFFL